MIDEAVERRGLDIEKKFREIKIKKKKKTGLSGERRGATANPPRKGPCTILICEALKVFHYGDSSMESTPHRR